MKTTKYELSTLLKNTQTPVGLFDSLKEARAALPKNLILIGTPEGTGSWMYFETEEWDNTTDDVCYTITKK